MRIARAQADVGTQNPLGAQQSPDGPSWMSRRTGWRRRLAANTTADTGETSGSRQRQQRASMLSRLSSGIALVTFSKRRAHSSQAWDRHVLIVFRSVLCRRGRATCRLCTSSRCGCDSAPHEPWSLQQLEIAWRIADERSRTTTPGSTSSLAAHAAFWKTRLDSRARHWQQTSSARRSPNCSPASSTCAPSMRGSTNEERRSACDPRKHLVRDRRYASATLVAAVASDRARALHTLMIAGFSGHLIAEQFLEQQIATHSSTDSTASASTPNFGSAVRASACSGRRQPSARSSSLRPHPSPTCWDFVASPMWNSSKTRQQPRCVPTTSSSRWSSPGGANGSIRGGARRSSRPDAVARRGACCSTAPTSGLLNAARVFSRRFVEFDLDCAADDEKTLSAMRTLISAEALARTTPTRRALVSGRARRPVGASRVGRVPIAARTACSKRRSTFCGRSWPGLTRSR